MAIWLTFALSLIAVVLSIIALHWQSKLEKSIDISLRLLKTELQTLRNAEEAEMIRDAEAGMSQAEREATIIK